ncbi:C6 transcription factor [Xylariales sp. AK1849]|nr:C6 transcription factor [Xylariales sp. AK1849]
MADTESSKSARKRRRPPKSCEQCRKRKLRCDRELPCKPCRRSRHVLQCSYQADTQRSATSQAPHSADLLEGGEPSDIVLGVENEAASRQRSCTPTASAWPPYTAASEHVPRPHLRMESEKTKLFGQSHWIHALEQFQVLAQLQAQAFTYRDHLQVDVASMIKEASNTRRAIKNERVIRLQEPVPDLISSIPPREICDQLLEQYLRIFEPMFRILHIPSFRLEYQAFWDHIVSATTQFLLKLVMVLTLGAIFHRDRAEAERVRKLAHSWIHAVQWWLTGPTERSAMNLDGMQVYCLLVLARQASSLGGATSMTTESLIKLAFTLGLHINPACFPLLSVFQREMRRRLWLTVLELTIMTSLDSTLPLLVSMEDFTSDLPSNINDADIHAKSETMPKPRVGGIFTDSSIQLLFQKSLCSRLSTVRRLNSVQPPPSFEETVKMGNDMKLHCREIATALQSISPDDANAVVFHRKFLDSYLRRYSMFVYRTFALQARKDPRYLFARKASLECCQIIASHAEALRLPSEILDDFALLAIRGSGLFKGPLSQDVIVTYSLEIATQLEEERESVNYTDTNHLSSDPLLQLSRTNRRPHIETLRHIREQLRQVIALGRPSCKRYIILSGMLAQIDGMEAGVKDPKEEVVAAMMDSMKDCCDLLRQAANQLSGAGLDTEWTEDTPLGWMDSFGLFGLDLDFLDPTMNVDIPELLGAQDISYPSNGLAQVIE